MRDEMDETDERNEIDEADEPRAPSGEPLVVETEDDRRRVERSQGQLAPAVCFGASILAALALAVVYAEGGQNQAEGVLLAIALGGIGIGLVLWAQRFMPEGPDREPRGRIGSTREDREAFVADFATGSRTFGRPAGA